MAEYRYNPHDYSADILREKPKGDFSNLASRITMHLGTIERANPKDVERYRAQLVEMTDELLGLAFAIAGIEDMDHVRRLRSGAGAPTTAEIAQRSRQLRQR